MTDFGKKISSVLSSMSKRDFEGALPYLLLTSKPESIVRDVLVFRLHEKFRGKNYAVAREWSRTDIAVLAPVLREGTRQFEDPKAIIEIRMVAAPAKGKKGISLCRHLAKIARESPKQGGSHGLYEGFARGSVGADQRFAPRQSRRCGPHRR